MVDLLFEIAAWIAAAAVLITFIRLVIGPTVPDRIAALDTMTIISLSVMVFFAFRSGRIIYLDVALVYGFVSFLGILTAARYLERGL